MFAGTCSQSILSNNPVFGWQVRKKPANSTKQNSYTVLSQTEISGCVLSSTNPADNPELDEKLLQQEKRLAELEVCDLKV